MKLPAFALMFLLTSPAVSLAIIDCLAQSPSKQATAQACDGTLPASIVGHWRIDPTRTQDSLPVPTNQTEASTAAAVPVLIITEGRFISEMSDLFRVETSYRIVGGSSNRYLIELFDEQGSGETLTLTLVPCGLKMSSIPDCSTEFCERKRDEVLLQLAKKTGKTLEEMKQAAQPNPTTTPLIAYYRC